MIAASTGSGGQEKSRNFRVADKMSASWGDEKWEEEMPRSEVVAEGEKGNEGHMRKMRKMWPRSKMRRETGCLAGFGDGGFSGPESTLGGVEGREGVAG